MTRIVIEEVQSRASLLAALSVVMHAFNCDEAYAEDERIFVAARREAGSLLIPSGERRSSVPARCRCCPAPGRGRHQRLTECWMCWCDVMRGAALEPEVITPHAWKTTQDP